jgi:ornithine carbamoyltransferase
MAVKHLLSIRDIGPEALHRLIERSVEFAAGSALGAEPLTGKVVGIYFRKPSTRTRSSFTVATLKLGGYPLAYGRNDLQLVTGEPIEDTARVLSGYLDALVIRTNDDISEMSTFARQEKMAIINAMSQNEHPTQAIADLSTIREKFGRLEGLHLLYLGEGNNTAVALALAVAQTPGMQITLVTPPGYGLHSSVLEQAAHCASLHGAMVENHHRMDKLPRAVDVVYTTRWQTMGEPHPDREWRAKFIPYSVTADVMRRVSKPYDTIFLHDLPAVRGEDVQEEVLMGPQSFVWRQACHKMFGAMAILEWCLNGNR